MHTALAEIVRGRSLVEIGTQNGDGMVVRHGHHPSHMAAPRAVRLQGARSACTLDSSRALFAPLSVHRVWCRYDFRRAGTRMPEVAVVALGAAGEYAFDRRTSDSSHTNPALFGTHRPTGQRVVFKLRRRSITRTLENDISNITRAEQEVTLTATDADARGEREHSGGVYSPPWAACSTEEGACPAEAVRALTTKGGAGLDSLRRLPFKPFAYSRLTAAVGLGSARDELFVSALLASSTSVSFSTAASSTAASSSSTAASSTSGVGPVGRNACSTPPGIVPILDVLEFTPNTTPRPLQAEASRLFAQIERYGKKVGEPQPPRPQERFIYALVFPQLEPHSREPHSLANESLAERRAFVLGLMSALRVAHARGIINFDLREGHVYRDRSDGTYRLIDWECALSLVCMRPHVHARVHARAPSHCVYCMVALAQLRPHDRRGRGVGPQLSAQRRRQLCREPSRRPRIVLWGVAREPPQRRTRATLCVALEGVARLQLLARSRRVACRNPPLA